MGSTVLKSGLAGLALALVGVTPAIAGGVPIPRPKPILGYLRIELPADSSQIERRSPFEVEAPAPAEELVLRPKLMFDTRRSVTPAAWSQVDPANAVPLMRQAAGVESEYIKKQVGIEVAYRAPGATAQSRFMFDLRTNGQAQDTVRAAIGIPLE
jgi:hypothetical protein